MAKNNLKIFSNASKEEMFNKIKLSVASPDQIRSWSFGEVKKPETINYRTFKPEKDGLFCAKIFGPTKDYECLCGKYRRIKYRGVICEKCGVEVTIKKVRRERMGHIELATSIAHIWFFKSIPSHLGTLLDLPMKKMESVIYFDNYIVIEPGLTPLKIYDTISEEVYQEMLEKYGEDSFRAGIGAEAFREILVSMDLEELRKELRIALTETKSETNKKKIVKRLKLVENFIESKTRPEWMVMNVLPVIPPDLRPLVPLDGGRFATSDLNDLYRRVINRNNRLKKLIDIKAPEIIVRNEKRMLQEAVDALFDNTMGSRPFMTHNKRAYKSLADNLKGKQGRFRQNLLGKRVDYSGRSVIVAGPELKLHECGLPKTMALELFKPFVLSKLVALGHANTIKTAKKMVEKQLPEVWDVLEDIIFEHPVLLNRAPTLHKLSVQAFEPKIIEGKAIQLHPLVCAAFNADFDGDQMAVHVTLSVEARLEARVLMLSSNNIIHPASGKPIIGLSQDMVLGVYWASLEKAGLVGEGKAFSSLDEIRLAMEYNQVELHTKIKARRFNGTKFETVDTTVGRMFINEIFPASEKLPFSLINRNLGKGEISDLIAVVNDELGQKEAVIFADKIKNLGFKYATKSGVSFGKDDIVVPSDKQKLLDDAYAQIAEFEAQYQDGLITKGEKTNKSISVWTDTTNRLADAMLKQISSGESFNSLAMMADSKARGSREQMRQLGAMRGLMAKPNGEIIETPVVSNFKEGLTVAEYFNSTHGARKGLIDTALKTADAGFFTRRLVDVAQDSIITQEDCGTENGLRISAVVEGSKIVKSLGARIKGRVAQEDVVDPDTKELYVKKGDLITEVVAKMIDKSAIADVFVRSPITCESKRGVCMKCYGRDTVQKQMVNMGEAVGVLAAQSIGEPGTQLTLRTFHVGGTAQIANEASSVEASINGKVVFRNENIIGEEENQVVISRNMEISLLDSADQTKSSFKIPYGAKLFVKNGQEVKIGHKIASWDPYSQPIITEVAGVVKFKDLVEHVSYSENLDVNSGVSVKTIIDWRFSSKGQSLKPRIDIVNKKGEVLTLSTGVDASYLFSIGATLSVKDGQEVNVGDIIAYLPRQTAKTADITGGLPRIQELFEARSPKNATVIVEKDGIVELGGNYRTRLIVKVTPDDGSEPIEYSVQKGIQLNVQSGDHVSRGDYLFSGSPAPSDILRILGVEALADYLTNEIQSVYRLQGIEINDKHFEIIIRQMLKKQQVVDAGDTAFLVGEEVDASELAKENEKVVEFNGRPAVAERVLLGITNASLKSKSFISAASFQHTTQVLTNAAVSGKEDSLEGLKENVIVGRLIPAGTGAYINSLVKIAEELDTPEEVETEDDSQLLPGM
ncbi:MAG: DNA-directed RNA polymerase subunit beta' [Rickettsiales bacterium]|jgi:DNA-directed RNA polymerase subunit beta'|nr:DNA-directed RNA polymerase subunit beta' [Rickettsiales bacterium]